MLNVSIHSVKEIKFNKKDVTNVNRFLKSLSESGITTKESFFSTIITIPNVQNFDQDDLDYVIARVYANCRKFSIIVVDLQNRF